MMNENRIALKNLYELWKNGSGTDEWTGMVLMYYMEASSVLTKEKVPEEYSCAFVKR